MLGTPRCATTGSHHLGQATTSSNRNQLLSQAGAERVGLGVVGRRRRKREVQSSNKT